MLLEKLTVTTTPDSEHALMVTAECREVIIVRTQVMAVPAEPGGTEPRQDRRDMNRPAAPSP